MIGIVLVSHSPKVAEGVAELAREMGGADIRLEPVGGLDMPDRPMGTDAVLVMQAIERAWSEDGVLVLMDLGSAVLSAEMALDMLPTRRPEGDWDPRTRTSGRRHRRRPPRSRLRPPERRPDRRRAFGSRWRTPSGSTPGRPLGSSRRPDGSTRTSA